MRIAFAGFRHGHIMGFHSIVQKDPRASIAAACEEDRETAAKAAVKLTHDNFQQMVESVDCDVIAVGDYFARRGALILAALKAGKHVISDKPICTSLDELDQIESLSRDKNLV